MQRKFKRTRLDELWIRHRLAFWACTYRKLPTGTQICAFNMALRVRNLIGSNSQEPIIYHSDKGGQYNSTDFKNLLKDHGMLSNMGSSGDCYDNAHMESLWATMKTELMHHKQSIVGYTCSTINAEGTHLSTACLPLQFEAQWLEQQQHPQIA